MLLEVMPAPRMAQGGGMPSYRSSRYSFSSSKVMMSTPAYGRIPICAGSRGLSVCPDHGKVYATVRQDPDLRRH